MSPGLREFPPSGRDSFGISEPRGPWLRVSGAIEAQERRTRNGKDMARRAAMTPHCALNVFSSALMLLGLLRQISASPNLRGVAPWDEADFRSETFMCKDGSKTLPRERLNDDFCDCVDGTDEPGTNACPESKFHCSNSGPGPVVLFSSAVNDGICDCCDGSDEFDGKTLCRHFCLNPGEDPKEKDDAWTEEDDVGQGMARELELKSLLRREKTDLRPAIINFKDLKLVLLLELVSVAGLCWWQFSAAKRMVARRRPRNL